MRTAALLTLLVACAQPAPYTSVPRDDTPTHRPDLDPSSASVVAIDTDAALEDDAPSGDDATPGDGEPLGDDALPDAPAPEADAPRPAAPPPTAPPDAPTPRRFAPVPACAVALSLRRDPADPYRIEAVATDRTGDGVVLRVPSRCPAGPAVFSGLPAPYDYHRVCNAGACHPGSPDVVEIAVPPGGSVVVDRIDLEPDGGPCNRPLPKGRHTIAFTLPGLEACPPKPLTVTAGKACPPMPPCGLGCDGPFAKDADGCTLCACAESPIELFRGPSR